MAMKSITQSQLKDLLDYNPATGVFTNKVTRNTRAKQGDVAGTLNALGYVVIQVNKQKSFAHRLAWLYAYGCWPKNQIDHINRVRNDNRLCNLRDVTSSENIHNSGNGLKNTSGVRNVVWHKRNKKWQAQIMVNNKYKYLGLFDCIDKAKEAAKAAAKILHPARVV